LLLALPCGLLQSALLIAALASTPAQGALAMASFAAASSLGLWLPGAIGARWSSNLSVSVLMLRLAGATLAVASAWARWRTGTARPCARPTSRSTTTVPAGRSSGMCSTR
jgi:sulfite exporter TauE/SafE